MAARIRDVALLTPRAEYATGGAWASATAMSVRHLGRVRGRTGAAAAQPPGERQSAVDRDGRAAGAAGARATVLLVGGVASTGARGRLGGQARGCEDAAGLVGVGHHVQRAQPAAAPWTLERVDAVDATPQ